MKALLTIEEASDHIKLGRRVLFSEDQLEEWVNSCSISSAGYAENPIEDCQGPYADEFEKEAGTSV
jgi:hypothetical protein